MEIVKKVLRWLLRHSFVILLIVVVMYGYIFWGNLLGKDTPAGKVIAYLSTEFVEVKEFVAAVKQKQEKLTAGGQPSEQQPTEQQTALLSDLQHDSGSSAKIEPMQGAPVESEAADSDAAENKAMQADPLATYAAVGDGAVAESGNSVEQQAENTHDLGNDTQQDADEAAATALDVATDQEQSDEEMKSASQGDAELAFVSPEIEQSLEKVDNQGRPVDSLSTDDQRAASQSRDSQSRENKSADDSVKADWIMARKSFYQRRYDLSENSYQKVIDNTEDNFDAYGELGNVYFNQGKSQQAASAYLEAANILVRVGQLERAKSLLGLLFYLDKSKANELQRSIESAES